MQPLQIGVWPKLCLDNREGTGNFRQPMVTQPLQIGVWPKLCLDNREGTGNFRQPMVTQPLQIGVWPKLCLDNREGTGNFRQPMVTKPLQIGVWPKLCLDSGGEVELHCPRMSVDILRTICNQCRSTVQCCFTSTETVKPVLNCANICSRTYLGVFGEYSWFISGRTFAS